MTPSTYWTTPLTPDECADRLARACCALDKLAHYTPHDEVYFGDFKTFAQHSLNYVMAPHGAQPSSDASRPNTTQVTP